MTDSRDIIISNLKGFLRKGARSDIQSYIPTGHFKLDFIINNGSSPDSVDLSSKEGYDPNKIGMPSGKLVELFGEEGSGKSSLAYRVVGYAQKMGYKAAWIDTEHSFSDNLAVINGVNQDDLYYADMTNEDNADTTYYAEDIFDAIINMCQNGIKCIVLDSVANLSTKAAMEGSAHDIQIGDVARLMSKELRKIVNYAGKFGVLVIFINQIREKIGVMFGNPETTPGGRSLRFNASLRIRLSKNNRKEAEIYISDENDQVRMIGRKANARIVKNRFAKPFMEVVDIPIYYEPYFPDIEDVLFDVGRQLKLISVRKGVYSWKEVKEEGRGKFLEKLKFEGLINSLIDDIKSKSEELGTILPPELVSFEPAEKDNGSDESENDNVAIPKKRVSRSGKGKSSSAGNEGTEE